jgi:hypothetical protein
MLPITMTVTMATQQGEAQRSLPEGVTLVYGPSVSVVTDTSVYGTKRETTDRPLVMRGTVVSSGPARAFLMVCEGQLIELASNSILGIDHEHHRLVLKAGIVTLHAEEHVNSTCFSLVREAAVLRNASRNSISVVFVDSSLMLRSGGVLLGSPESSVAEGWWEKAEQDGRYLFELLRSGALPAEEFRFDFPSERRRRSRFRHSAIGEGGIATYNDQRYYIASILYRVRAPEAEFVYDFWFALSKDGDFYNEAWDQWKDLIDHIHHLQLRQRGDPWNLRIGLIEGMSWERGLLVDRYSNAVYLPFERHNGLQVELNRGDTYGTIFVNDIGKPRVLGARVSWLRDQKTRLTVNYVGDLDQLSNLSDSDGDSYPDGADPEPDTPNLPSDSVIVAIDPPRLDAIESEQLHAVSVGLAYRYRETETTSVSLTGEAAAYSKVGSGITFPNIVMGYRSLRVGVGFDLQSPRFISGIFDRNYEFDKARFQTAEDSTVYLVTHGQELEDTGDWLFGWNNSLAVRLPMNARFGMRFRDIYRGDERDKSFWLSLGNERRETRYRIRGSFFIEQKNVSELLRKRTHGQIWGAQFTFYPHHTARVRFRYRERSSDDDGDGLISSTEIGRNVNMSVTVDGTYWWERFQQWWEARGSKEEK